MKLFAERRLGRDRNVARGGRDPFVRQQLADHPSWVDGLTFAGGRLTAEVGPAPFETFERKYEAVYGVDRVGVKTREGRQVIQPPETGMYAYDFVNLLAAAVVKAGSTDPRKIATALEEVTIEGANGDERALWLYPFTTDDVVKTAKQVLGT